MSDLDKIAELEQRLVDCERLLAQTPEVRAADERLRGERLHAAAAAASAPPPAPVVPLVRVVVAEKFGRDILTPPIRDDRGNTVAGSNVLAYARTALDDITRAPGPLAHYVAAPEWKRMLATDPELVKHLTAGNLTAAPCSAAENAEYTRIWGQVQRASSARSGQPHIIRSTAR